MVLNRWRVTFALEHALENVEDIDEEYLYGLACLAVMIHESHRGKSAQEIIERIADRFAPEMVLLDEIDEDLRHGLAALAFVTLEAHPRR